MTTEDIRKGFRVTQKELSEIFNIPLGTIKNWDARNCMPEYMAAMMWNMLILRNLCNKYAEEAYKFDNMKKQFCAGSDVINAAMEMTKVSYKDPE